MTPSRIRALIAESLSVAPHRVEDDDVHLYSDLEADCISHCQMVLALEDEFGTEIPDSAAEGFKTVGDVIAYFQKERIAA